MNPVKIKKEELVKILKANLQRHQESFERAWTAYVEHERARVEELYEKAKAGRQVHRDILALATEPIPKNHRQDYERIIRAVELHDDAHFVLSEQEFAQYVQDDWRWKREFVQTSAAYGTASDAEIAYYIEE